MFYCDNFSILNLIFTSTWRYKLITILFYLFSIQKVFKMLCNENLLFHSWLFFYCSTMVVNFVITLHEAYCIQGLLNNALNCIIAFAIYNYMLHIPTGQHCTYVLLLLFSKIRCYVSWAGPCRWFVSFIYFVCIYFNLSGTGKRCIATIGAINCYQ